MTVCQVKCDTLVKTFELVINVEFRLMYSINLFCKRML